MSKNQKPEQTPTEEAQAATAEQKAEEIATEQKAIEIAAEEQASADKVKQDAEADEQAAKEQAKLEAAAAAKAVELAAKEAEAKFTVIMRFFSKDKIQYEIGDDVSHLDAERLDSLVNRGLVSKS